MDSLANLSTRLTSAVASLALMLTPLATYKPVSTPSPTPHAAAVETYRNLPLSFEPNVGQAAPGIQFISRSAAADTMLTSTGALFAVKPPAPSFGGQIRHQRQSAEPVTGALIAMTLAGANPAAMGASAEQLPGKSNYLIGDQAAWHTEVPSFRKVKYSDVYPGIDVVYYGTQRQLEYDFVVAPGANPRAIELVFQGMDSLVLDREGNLVLRISGKELIQKRPYAYQTIDGAKREVTSRYELSGLDRVALRVGPYDASRALVIDPLLAYSTYFGGTGADQALAVAVDAWGNTYVAGYTSSTDLQTTPNAFDRVPAGSYDVFVTKLNASGSAIIYSTYLGGSGDEFAYGLAVDSQGNAYVVGDTNSTNFPTVNAVQATLGGGVDAFVSKLNPNGSALVYSTYLGGSGIDDGLAIAVDEQGSAYVAGDTNSSNFPRQNPIQPALGGGFDAYFAKLTPAGTALVYSTYLGGASDDYAYGVAVDSSGNAYVAGLTGSSNFPTSNALQGSLGGRNDAFLTKVNASGSALVYSTYLGGAADDWANGIAVDSSGNVYLTGQTSSTNFPTLNPFQASLAGPIDAFVTKLNPAGSALVYSSFLGGANSDIAMSIAVDDLGSAYLAGYTNSTDFPLVGATQSSAGGGYDAFVAKLNASGSALAFSTYLGGNNDDFGSQIACDGSGNIYVVGSTSSANLPTVNALQPTYGGASDAFIAKFGSSAVQLRSVSPASQVSAAGIRVTLTGLNFAPGATVTFGDVPATDVNVPSGTTLSALTPPHAAGVVDVAVTNPNGQSGRLVGGFTYVAHPALTSIDMPTGSSAGGVSVTLTGTNLAAGATVTFGGNPATNVVVTSATSITAVTPAHNVGVVDVTVTNPDGQQAVLSGGYTFVDSVASNPSPSSPNNAVPAQGCNATAPGPSIIALAFALGGLLLLSRRVQRPRRSSKQSRRGN